ncbi:ABC transporter substrate-binding protein [Candidatus Enterovibrio altilux]|nr:ABC transporter substrate-binding protein [Candidatus Enterovibrio luxaltus]
MKIWLISLFFAVNLLMSSMSLAAIDASNPYHLINAVADNVFSRLKSDKDAYEANPELLRVIVEEELMPYINVRYAAMNVLGSRVKLSTKKERDIFTDAFYSYMVASYAQILAIYTNNIINVEPAKAIDAKSKVISVRIDMNDNSSRPPVRLDFKLRKNSKTQEWQGFDLQIEGVSMLSTTASEWNQQLRKKSITSVAKKLISRSKIPIHKNENTS